VPQVRRRVDRGHRPPGVRDDSTRTAPNRRPARSAFASKRSRARAL
jgi:hypothetical protein